MINFSSKDTENALWTMYESYQTNWEKASLLSQWITITNRYINEWKKENDYENYIKFAENFVLKCQEKLDALNGKLN